MAPLSRNSRRQGGEHNGGTERLLISGVPHGDLGPLGVMWRTQLTISPNPAKITDSKRPRSRRTPMRSAKLRHGTRQQVITPQARTMVELWSAVLTCYFSTYMYRLVGRRCMSTREGIIATIAICSLVAPQSNQLTAKVYDCRGPSILLTDQLGILAHTQNCG